MRRLVLLLAVSLVALPASAGEKQQPAQPDCAKLKAAGLTGDELAKRGCCSWHNGVCGCSGGRKLCCDGTLSPTCTCAKDGPAEPIVKVLPAKEKAAKR